MNHFFNNPFVIFVSIFLIGFNGYKLYKVDKQNCFSNSFPIVYHHINNFWVTPCTNHVQCLCVAGNSFTQHSYSCYILAIQIPSHILQYLTKSLLLQGEHVPFSIGCHIVYFLGVSSNSLLAFFLYSCGCIPDIQPPCLHDFQNEN